MLPPPEQPLLSIAVPTYNRASLLDICLGRLTDQVRPHGKLIELIVSNNASTDATREVAAKHRNTHPAIRYYENPTNAGPDYNIARCFELALGKYIWVFSDDDLLLPGAIDRLLPLLATRDFGIITLAPLFYRNSIHENTIDSPPLTWALRQNPTQLAQETHFWLTYITGIITNKEAAGPCDTLYSYDNSHLIQLRWVMPALFSNLPSARITSPLILGRALGVLDFRLFHVFGPSYAKVLARLAHEGAIPSELKTSLIKLVITKYFPTYLRPGYEYTHGERPVPLLFRAFWAHPSFWTTLVPLFLSRRPISVLHKASRRARRKVRGLAEDLLGRMSRFNCGAEARATARRLMKFGPESRLPAGARISNPQCVSIEGGVKIQPGIVIDARILQGETHPSPSITIGNFVHIGYDCHLDCCNQIKISDWVYLGHRVSIRDHEIDSTPTAIRNHPPANRKLVSKGAVLIEPHVLVESDVIIMAGVTIGANSIIRSRSVVTESMPANVIAAGAPAKVIRERIDEVDSGKATTH